MFSQNLASREVRSRLLSICVCEQLRVDDVTVRVPVADIGSCTETMKFCD
jgi:hypothetical protein